MKHNEGPDGYCGRPIHPTDLSLLLLSCYAGERLVELFEEGPDLVWHGRPPAQVAREVAMMHARLDRACGGSSAPLVDGFYLFRRGQLAAMPYREYLRTAEWGDVRHLALQCARGRCALCNGPDRLDVHHRTYARRGHESLTDVTVLCRGCHELFHRHGRGRR